MTRTRTIAALVAGLLLPLVANAQGANAKVDPKIAHGGAAADLRDRSDLAADTAQ